MKSSHSIKRILTVVIAVPLLAWLLTDSLAESDALTYYKGVDAVLAHPEEVRGKRIRVSGHVVKGSILQKPGTLQYQFQVKPMVSKAKHPEHLDGRITVRYNGVVPDTFKDDAEVVVTGVLDQQNLFQGSELIAKCPSKYEAEKKNLGTY